MAHAESLKKGPPCYFAGGADPTREAGWRTGVVGAGPLVIVDDTDPTIVHTGSIRCAFQLNQSTHSGTPVGTVTSATTPFVVWLLPSQVSFMARSTDTVYLCSTLTTEEGTWRYDYPSMTWTTSSTAGCQPTTIGST